MNCAKCATRSGGRAWTIPWLVHIRSPHCMQLSPMSFVLQRGHCIRTPSGSVSSSSDWPRERSASCTSCLPERHQLLDRHERGGRIDGRALQNSERLCISTHRLQFIDAPPHLVDLPLLLQRHLCVMPGIGLRMQSIPYRAIELSRISCLEHNAEIIAVGPITLLPELRSYALVENCSGQRIGEGNSDVIGAHFADKCNRLL